VQVAGTADGGEVLGVATSVSLFVVGVKAGCGVEGLMDIAKVVDDHTESEGSSIGIDGEVLGDLLVVVGAEVIVTGALEPLGKVGKGTNNIVISHFVVGVVIEGVTVDSVGLIDEVPSCLEAVLGLDIVSESSTLGEGVVDLTFGEGRLGHLEGMELGESSFKDSGVFVFEEALGLGGDYKY
jgi:hypothetical protein